MPCRLLLRVFGNEIRLEQDGQTIARETVADPLEYLREFRKRYEVPAIPGLPRFTGGLVGYFGYDTVRAIEPVLGPSHKPDEIGGPDILLMVSDEVVVFDNLAGKLYVVIHVDPSADDAYANGLQRLDELVDKLHDPLPLPRAGVEIGRAHV